MTELKDDLESVCGMYRHVMHVRFMTKGKDIDFFFHVYVNNGGIHFVEPVFYDEDLSISITRYTLNANLSDLYRKYSPQI